MLANVRRDAYFPNLIPRYCMLQKLSDSALEVLECKAGSKVENYSSCEKKNAFWFFKKKNPVFSWGNSPSDSQAGGLLGSGVWLHYVCLVSRPWHSDCAGRCLSAPSSSQCHDFEVLHLVCLPPSSAAHFSLGSFNLCLSTSGYMGVSPSTDHREHAFSRCPRCLPSCPQETQVREASTQLASSVGIPLPLPWPPLHPL